MMDFHWSLSDSGSPQVSRTLLSILVDLINAALRIFSILPRISSPLISFFVWIYLSISIYLTNSGQHALHEIR